VEAFAAHAAWAEGLLERERYDATPLIQLHREHDPAQLVAAANLLARASAKVRPMAGQPEAGERTPENAALSQSAGGRAETEGAEGDTGDATGSGSEEQVEADSATPSNLAELADAPRLAFLAYSYAEERGHAGTDRNAYDWLNEEGLPDEFGDYELPPFDTWQRYLGRARNALGEQKYQRRKGRLHGGSIRRRDEI
jgi:hypothetical protein